MILVARDYMAYADIILTIDNQLYLFLVHTIYLYVCVHNRNGKPICYVIYLEYTQCIN